MTVHDVPRKTARDLGLAAFYPILPDAAWIKRLVPLGIGTVQLRFKGADPQAIRREIAESLEVCAAHGCLLIVNDHWREALALGAEAVHLGQEDLRDADVATIAARAMKVGISTHNATELEVARAAGANMIALGPIFAPRGKIVDHPPQGLARIGEWRRRIGETPLIAIGGITLAQASEVIAAGADSIAVITDVTGAEDPQARVRLWLDWQRQLGK